MAVSESAARDMAMTVFLHITEDQEILQQFLAASGLRPGDLRAAAVRPDFAAAVLDFLLEDDSRVLRAAAAMGLPPQTLMGARTALAGPGAHGWEPD